MRGFRSSGIDLWSIHGGGDSRGSQYSQPERARYPYVDSAWSDGSFKSYGSECGDRIPRCSAKRMPTPELDSQHFFVAPFDPLQCNYGK